MVPRFGLAGVHSAHGDQAEPEVADFGEQPVQRGLVSEQAADDRLLALAADLEAIEPGGPPAVQDTRDADLIPRRPAGGAHPSSSRRPGGAAERDMPGGADCARRKDPRLPCPARAGLRAAIPVLAAGCVSFICGRYERAPGLGVTRRWHVSGILWSYHYRRKGSGSTAP